MTLIELLNIALSLLEQTPNKGFSKDYSESWIRKNGHIYLPHKNTITFMQIIEKIYFLNTKICERFSYQTVSKYIKEKLVDAKSEEMNFSETNSKDFFKYFEDIKAKSNYVIAPICGVRLDKKDKVNISIFEIGKQRNLKGILSNDSDGYYIAVKIDNVYDNILAIEEAKNKFSDFIRLVIFITGQNDKRVILKVGLPSYPSMSNELMYVESSSYIISETINEEFPETSTINNILVNKVPIDDDFFINNLNFKKLWILYEKTENKFEERLLNASIALGESASSKNLKNSFIYTSMAFEILFSYDDGSLFQKSIGDRIADTFAFLIGDSAQHRMDIVAKVKKFYSLRSAIVHGGTGKIDNSYIAFNIFLRAAIDKLLNNEKYRNIKKIDDLYQMVKEAHYSY